MSELRDLYQEVILDHSKKPRNRRRPDGTNHEAHGYNPLCGDDIHVYLAMEDDRIRAIGFEGQGCAICTASASVMTEVAQGRTRKEAQELFQTFRDMVTGHPTGRELGKLAVFAGVAEYPVRIKCANLPWHTLNAALEETDETVTTE